jgi:hypothetical protein
LAETSRAWPSRVASDGGYSSSSGAGFVGDSAGGGEEPGPVGVAVPHVGGSTVGASSGGFSPSLRCSGGARGKATYGLRGAAPGLSKRGSGSRGKGVSLDEPPQPTRYPMHSAAAAANLGSNTCTYLGPCLAIYAMVGATTRPAAHRPIIC